MDIFKKRKGQSLIEVTVAILIAAITATGIFSVILSTKYSHAKADEKESAAIVFRSAQEYLKPYVGTSADNFNASNNIQNIYGEEVWALQENYTHNLDFLLTNMPQFIGSTFTYTVSIAPCLSNTDTSNNINQCRSVNFNLQMPEDR